MKAPTLSEIELLAFKIRHLAAHEPNEAGLALAWLTRNVIETSCVPWPCVWEILHQLGAAGQPDLPAIEPPGPQTIDASFCRALAQVAAVWAGECDDLTGGATHAHRHDQNPCWSRQVQPTALIGSWVFYRNS